MMKRKKQFQIGALLAQTGLLFSLNACEQMANKNCSGAYSSSASNVSTQSSADGHASADTGQESRASYNSVAAEQKYQADVEAYKKADATSKAAGTIDPARQAELKKAFDAEIDRIDNNCSRDCDSLRSQATATYQNALVEATTAAANNHKAAPQLPALPVKGSANGNCSWMSATEVSTGGGLSSVGSGLWATGQTSTSPIPDDLKNEIRTSWLRYEFGDTVGSLLASLVGDPQFIAAAFASLPANTGVMNKMELSQNFSRFPEVYPQIQVLQSVRFGRKSFKGRDGVEILLTSVAGKKIRLIADRDWQRSCNLLDHNLESNGKIGMPVKFGQRPETVVPHPFQGKACSQQGISQYFFLNFDTSTAWMDSKAPQLVLLVGQNGQPLPGGHVFVDHDRRTGLESKLNAELMQFFDPKRYQPSAKGLANAAKISGAPIPAAAAAAAVATSAEAKMYDMAPLPNRAPASKKRLKPIKQKRR